SSVETGDMEEHKTKGHLRKQPSHRIIKPSPSAHTTKKKKKRRDVHGPISTASFHSHVELEDDMETDAAGTWDHQDEGADKYL
ncbi:hypothetical protein ElyMa_005256500, partial [Elysia marginata]